MDNVPSVVNVAEFACFCSNENVVVCAVAFKSHIHCSNAFAVPRKNICTKRNKHLCRFHGIMFDGNVKRRLALIVFQVDVCFFNDKERY